MTAPSEAHVVAVFGPGSLAQCFEREGWQVQPLKSPSELAGFHEGEAPRAIVVGASRLGVRRLEVLLGELRSLAPPVDIVVWRPDASAAFVRRAFRAGAFDVVPEPEPGAILAATDAAVERQRLLPQIEELSRARQRSGRFEGMLSRNDTMWELFSTIARTGPSDANVLITGETGTGKDLLARAVHRRSKRQGRFVAVNCSAIRPEIAESELFGHERGAFTGASEAKPGLFRHADGGTLLLDEIGNMPGQAQQSLLRVLQERRIRPVGGTREVAVDVRVVAATNTPLREAVEAGRFREDLLYRLDVIRLSPPPLRQRPEDVLYLFGHFLRALARRYGVARPGLSQGFIDGLVGYDWPGNVRQLENTVERLLLEGDRETLTARDLKRVLPRVAGGRPARATAPPEPPEIDASRSLAETLEPATHALERSYLEAVLREKRGRILESARHAGISRRTLLRKMNQYALDKRDFREPA